MPKKLKLNSVRQLVLLALILLSIIGIVLGFILTQDIKGLVAQKQEAERPAEIEMISIITPNCDQCQQAIDVYMNDILQSFNIEIINQTEFSFGDNDAQKIIDEFQIKEVPVVILSGEIDKDEQIKQGLINLGEEKNGSIVISGGEPPYQIVGTEEIVGEFKVTYLTDDTCDQCYDVQVHKDILESLGMYPFKEDTINKDSAIGRDLINRYNIEKVPTVLIDGDLESYSILNEVWQDVGRITDDKTYIFDAVEQMGTYRDLTQNKIVEAQFQDQQSVHNHVNFLVFINGKQFDFANDPDNYFVRDQNIHLEGSSNEGAAGKVIHVHDSGFTMQSFLETLGWSLNVNCLATDTGESYCNESSKKLKVYLNGEIDNTFGSGELQDRDQYLVSFGSESDNSMQEQVEKVPDFAF